ncbi:MFS transporter [Microbacterium sp. ASV49]|uniref:MFS transporter n=1 Tax=Microbacterium candidum TaxID=3041922 RepID=A0ABT7MUW5_9MICO|nr:MFS transporter [Microbacterium sp. ASV49]MDL9978242.1 MFS transporter [Microbacterium sp. ASV49]
MTRTDTLGGAFARYWVAVAISAFGSAVTAVAMPVLVVQVLHATPVQVGIVNATQILPYAVIGLFAGVVVDRTARRPLAIWASVGRAIVLGLIPVLWALGMLEIWTLAALLFLFGSFSVFGFAATQSLLPSLVSKGQLLRANGRLDQTDAAAQTAGPALGGALVGLLGAPLAILVDAASYLTDAVLLLFVRVAEPPRERTRRRVWADIREGLHWVYGHRTLRALAVSAQVWFFANSLVLTAFAIFALRTLDLSPAVYGLLFAASGVAAFVGATFAPRAGHRYGEGPVIVVAMALYPVAWMAVALAPHGGGPASIAVIAAALVVHGFAGGLSNANEMGYRQAVTPDEQLGRTNATMRSANRTVAAVGAVAGGALIALLGPTVALWCGVAVYTAALAIALFSPMRTARVDRPAEAV